MVQFNAVKIVCLIPPHYDFLCASVIDGLKQLDCRLFCSERTNNATEKDYIPPQDLAVHCSECDRILLFSNTGYQERRKFIVKNGLAGKTVYIDGSDFTSLEDPEALNTFEVCFKREVPSLKAVLKPQGRQEQAYTLVRRLQRYFIFRRKLWPLPFAAEQVYFRSDRGNVKKDIPVSCTLVPKNCAPERDGIIKCVRGMNIAGAIAGPVSQGHSATESGDGVKNDYFKVLAGSRISIAYPGLGFDTGRFWEILANKALLFSPPIRIRMPHPFLEYQHFIPYSSLGQLKDRLLHYLKEEKARERIARQGYEHLLRYHTSKERAKYLLGVVFRQTGSKAGSERWDV